MSGTQESQTCECAPDAIAHIGTKKRCSKCNKVKPVTEFWKRPERKGGLRSQCKACSKQYITDNWEQQSERLRSWRERNPEKVKLSLKKTGEKRRQNIITRLSMTVSHGMWRALHSEKHGISWLVFVDWDAEDLKRHLEGLFQPGMTWENYGEWHVDHIRPIASFEIRSHEDEGFKKCWALDNLQPLWAVENHKKGARWGTK